MQALMKVAFWGRKPRQPKAPRVQRYGNPADWHAAPTYGHDPHAPTKGNYEGQPIHEWEGHDEFAGWLEQQHPDSDVHRGKFDHHQEASSLWVAGHPEGKHYLDIDDHPSNKKYFAHASKVYQKGLKMPWAERKEFVLGESRRYGMDWVGEDKHGNPIHQFDSKD